MLRGGLGEEGHLNRASNKPPPGGEGGRDAGRAVQAEGRAVQRPWGRRQPGGRGHRGEQAAVRPGVCGDALRGRGQSRDASQEAGCGEARTRVVPAEVVGVVRLWLRVEGGAGRLSAGLHVGVKEVPGGRNTWEMVGALSWGGGPQGLASDHVALEMP